MKIKNKSILMFFIFCLSILLLSGCDKEQKLESTNLDGIDISSDENTVTYHDGSKENIDEDYVALFVNGSLIKDTKVIWKDGVPMLPIDKVKKELKLDSMAEKDAAYQVKPLKEDGLTYVGIYDIEQLLGVTMSYYDSTDNTKVHLLENTQQVLISSYQKDTKALTEEEAIELLKKQLIIAYENRFGDYNKESSQLDKEEKDYHLAISNLAVSKQQDRFYIIPFVFDFWVDKYTGDVFVYYNGLNQTINKFDPNSKYALMFAG